MHEWREDIKQDEWDRLLVRFKGHPLQSAKWGNSRRDADGIHDRRLAIYRQETPVFLARVEERRLFRCIKLAWMPGGPVMSTGEAPEFFLKMLLRKVRNDRFLILAYNPCVTVDRVESKKFNETIWLNLTLGEEILWKGLHKQFRYEVRRADKRDVRILTSKSLQDVEIFYRHCSEISRIKKFRLNTSVKQMMNLLQNSDVSVESELFIATCESEICGGAFVIRCGERIHYLWGAVDRTFAKYGIGEALQWQIVKWGIEKKCVTYDLEGIDPGRNPGTYHFKKRLGGQIVPVSARKIIF